MGHVLLDTRENSFLSEFCVEEILLLELINAVCPVASVSSSSSERITKAISIICSSSTITHFYESIIKPYSQQIPRKDSCWKVKDLFVGIGVFCCFFSTSCWLFSVVPSPATRLKHRLQGKKMKHQQWQRPAYCRIILNSLFLTVLLSLLLNDSVIKCHPFPFQDNSQMERFLLLT